ncbi:hypothetical protein [Blastococcus xanthinilyticus]|uniref:Uncharacterized protein n=1 Tax=Blastococcus xanthinilyticus TaxID=1564164 RepID=A0A5S5CWG0_9ACTN|nr:hypothetical protein [Blastococcus xanthinilyticus]TYP87176.1 hypothetical protein BD833_107116 [Blastococcus xanthinilyticus]
MLGPLLTETADHARPGRPHAAGSDRGRGPHVHWFRRVGEDPFSSATLYRCRCGVVRAGF